MKQFMQSTDTLNMNKATPAIGYDTKTERYFVLGSSTYKSESVGSSAEELNVKFPLTVFCGISLLGCLIALFLYITKRANQIEKEKDSSKVQDKRKLDIVFNSSQQTIPESSTPIENSMENHKSSPKAYKDEVYTEEI